MALLSERCSPHPFPSKPQLWDPVDARSPSRSSSISTAPTYLKQHSSFASRAPMQHRAYSVGPAVTDSTKFSVDDSNNNACTTISQKKEKSSSRRSLKIGRFNILKLPLRQRKPLSESQLRKRLRRHAEKGNWDTVRKLLANYEFSDVPEVLTKPQQQQQQQAKRDSFVLEKNPLQDESSRRPSYGSANGLRRSFTGKESAAAAAAIKAALLEVLEESSSSDCDGLDIGENILHDVCRHQPPLDVIEVLIKALRHRRGATSGTDDQGRTPLHLAADTGALPEVIGALVRADPYPASMGDVDRRSPLHLAMKYLSSTAQEKKLISLEEASDRTYRTVLILKDAMLKYPGKIDFKTEDNTGYSPLDYAIERNTTKEELIQSLIRRKEPTISRDRTPRQKRGLHRLTHQSSISDHDIEILLQLEQDEVEARRIRLEQDKACHRPKEPMTDALFDVFGIEESAHANSLPEVVDEQQQQPSSPTTQSCSQDDSPSDEGAVSGPEEEEEQAASAPVTTDDDIIYNQHLQDYLDDCMDDFSDLEYCDEDGFDILDDPSEAPMNETSVMINDESEHKEFYLFELPFSMIVLSDDDDCLSVVSEITVPLARILS